ncbi:hypothetical protein SAMN05192558_101233 [Actinokineospora alba]|uniref:Uncharacterized protein n=1 Tax=Actinokineospora alba TaxID=504798 RepID=A0A1H0F532_9PSEU|nr:hypothetical protein [Actinokineospora alba]TDP69343.1 hypothetical protein C8E96_4929 [Actinokineospora alba]SDI18826.1 hypothetical protein SAMN05421871_103637 [Actinokineospora alba]SDN89757.1 hypothetical protein SAMN05192558_101233 [Actinokineospora alba]
MAAPFDPTTLITAVPVTLNAGLNIVNTAMTISEKFAIAQAQYNRFHLTELSEIRTTLPDDEKDGHMVEFRLRDLDAQPFTTRLEYTRHCRVAGVRRVRHRLDLRLTGSVAPYVAVYKDRLSPTSWDEIVEPAVDRDGKPIYGFAHVSLGIGDNPGMKTFPFSKFNDLTVFNWQVSLRRSGVLEFTWTATSSGLAPGGMPLALSKAKSGRFLLTDGGVLTPVGADSRKYFKIHPLVVPAPFPELPAREIVSTRREPEGAQARIFPESVQDKRGRKTRFKSGQARDAAHAVPREGSPEGEPEQPRKTGVARLFRRMTGRSRR